MTNRSKQIGTMGESAVVAYLRENGFPYAERRSLNGSQDEGDITGTPGICWEIKTGQQPQTLIVSLVNEYLEQTEKETLNSGADIGILVVQRRSYGPKRVGEWWAIVDGDALKFHNDSHVYMSLAACVRMLRRMGYGDPIVDVE